MADDTTKRDDGGGPNPRNEKPISHHPLTPEEALRRALNVTSPPEEPKPSENKPGR